MEKLVRNSVIGNQKGAVAVYVAITAVFFIMIGAFAIDFGHLYAVRNEMHNAADAGALAGASQLYDYDENTKLLKLTTDAAVDEAEKVTNLNKSEGVDFSRITAETGHWSFTSKSFSAYDSDSQPNLIGRSFYDIDNDLTFINAVRVTVDRDDIASFFARIFNVEKLSSEKKAVAYLGFAGVFAPGEFDQPIAVCQQSIENSSGNYDCTMGRMLNSGNNQSTSNTGGWTNFSQPCQTASDSGMSNLICQQDGSNPDEVTAGQGIGATGGVQDNTFGSLFECWKNATGQVVPWNLTLPVVDCPGHNVSNCAKLVGAVNLNVIWMIHQNDPQFNDIPREMTAEGYDPYSCPAVDGETKEQRIQCWKKFVDNFNLANVNGPPTTDREYEDMYQKKSLFYLPDCDEYEPTGTTGGGLFNVPAKVPVLVE